MTIRFEQDSGLFYLRAHRTSYIMKLVKSKYLAHIYWGESIRQVNGDNLLRFQARPFSPVPLSEDPSFSLDTLPQEFASFGRTDLRFPSFQVERRDGTRITDLEYRDHKIYDGKPILSGLPATYVDNDSKAQTLEITMLDPVLQLQVILQYTVFERENVITRSVRFENIGKEKLILLRALSMSIDFSDSNFDLLRLSGAWGRERQIERASLHSGIQSIESRRGASSHQQNPFMALLRKDATEDYGEVYGFSFVYSGNFIAAVEVDQYDSARISMGINPFEFSWVLDPGEEFQTPEVVMVYSSNGIGGMSRTYHRLYREHLSRGRYRDTERPVLINNWEATYFDFDHGQIEDLSSVASDLGLELFVLDDGWFGHREDDTSSLGDWIPHKSKLPIGIDGLAASINKKGLAFGLWFEPEMVSVDSNLYRQHPDWCIHVPDRTRSEGRNQLILDFSKKEVCAEIIRSLSEVLLKAPVSYVKWDMNRNMSEVGSSALPPERQRETYHRYMLGLYQVLEEITSKFPDILFESCSGGGGRFDPGMLYYMPQTWTSDNTDAVSRLRIQYGTSIVYPAVTMGSHVSMVPNHQVGRITPLEFRGHVAMSGNLGYELDVQKLSTEEQAMMREQVSVYKEIRHIVQFGDFYRLRNPFECNETAWEFISEDRTEILAFYFKELSEANPPIRRLKLKGLDVEARYQVTSTDEMYYGDELMQLGIFIPPCQQDFKSFMWHFKVV
ncbi:alpha-galactosidase [Alicyclobacillus sp. SO9]|uniref:alpha-galactosidase n=1 Tax=Alicyclobacillus sp. SO9 TaxID=2665646 RepID=UPI0018E8755E|nr:alpha-galactosidase [Alicyclobacillus sp. SO9]QQE77996.1 alpha-galactosidase [Alicyclobacillus sp. SO9]